MSLVSENKSDALDVSHGNPGENLFVPECGSGPGLLLMADGPVPAPSIQARAQLFAEEGYVVAVLCGAPGAPDVRAVAAD